MKRQMMAIAASASLLCAGSAGPEAVSHAAASPEVLSAHDTALTKSVFEDAKRFWSGRQAGSMATLRLVMLSGKEEFICHRAPGDVDKLTAMSEDQYCASDNTVVITALQNNADKFFGGGDMSNVLNVAHEVGHGEQEATNPALLAQAMGNKAVLKAAELQATEYAGEYMATVYTPESLQKVADFVCKVPPDGTHGSEAEQIDAFIQGVLVARPTSMLHGC